MNELTDRIGVVTGASAGIGLAMAEAMVEAGARVVINARRAERLQQTVRRLNEGKPQHRAVFVAGDAADEGVIEAMLDAARESFGSEADLVVVNAGRGLAGSVMTSDTKQWEEMVRVNLLGAARLMRAAGGRMADLYSDSLWGTSEARARDIIVIGSNVGRHISPFSSMYGSTKFGVNSLAEAQRRELAPKGIRVSLLEPGIVRSEFQQVAGYDPESFGALMEKFGPVLEPEDVARTGVYVASQPAHVHVNDVVIRPTRQDYP